MPRRHVFLFPLSFVIAACSSSSQSTVSQTIRADVGGKIVAPGAVLTIPPGALAMDTTITVRISDKNGQPMADAIAARVFDYGPNGTVFGTPAELTIDFQGTVPNGKKAVVAFLEAGTWVPLVDSTQSGATVTAHTTHFTPYTVVFIDGVQSGGMCMGAFDACGGDLTGTWVFNIGCANIAPEDAPIQNCPGSQVTVTAEPIGSIAFDPLAGTYVQTNFDINFAYSGTFPASCAPGGDCAKEIAAGASDGGNSRWSNLMATAMGATCVVSGNSDIYHGDGPTSEDGSLKVMGNQFQMQATGASDPSSLVPYCVRSDGSLQAQLTFGANKGSTVVFRATKQSGDAGTVDAGSVAPTDGSADAEDAAIDGASAVCPSPASGAACNNLSVFGLVTPTCTNAQPPTPQGGTIADGTYVLQSLTTYSPSCDAGGGPQVQETIVINGACEQAAFIQTPTTPSSPSLVRNATLRIEGGMIHQTVTCPAGTPPSAFDTIPYTAGAGGQLIFFTPNTNGGCAGGQCPGTSVFVLQKQ